MANRTSTTIRITWDDAVRHDLPALVRLRDHGVIGAIGAGMNQSAMLARFVRECDVDVVLCAGRYTLLEQPALTDLLPAALELSVGVVAAGVYNSGILSGEQPRPTDTYDYIAPPAHVVERAVMIAELCAAHGVTLPEAAIAFPSTHPAIVSTVVGVRDAVQSEQTLARAAAHIPEALWRDLTAAGVIGPAPRP